MYCRSIIAMLFGTAGIVGGQTAVDLRSQARNVDFTQAASTKPFQLGTGLPASCSQGQAYLRLDAPAGKNLYICASANVWTPQGGDYSF